MSATDNKPTTHQINLAKLPRALEPLTERPQWAVWRWTQSENGRWQKPPFMAMQPERHASTKDASTWSDYATALSAVLTGKADGITYVLTEDDPFAAIDLDHCRDIDTCSIDVWAQNFLEAGRASYCEVTPSGAGCRIWGLADGATLNKKFTLNIDGKDVAAELFRRTNKALTISGYRLDTITKLTNIDRVIDWAVIWGERRKAAAAEASVPINCNGFNGNGSGYGVDQIEQIVRTGVPDGKNRSDVFHTIVGHYLGCGWSAEQILEHLQQFPDGIGGRYLREDRLCREIARSAGKYARPELPLSGNGGWVSGWAVKTPQPSPEPDEEPEQPEPEQPSPEPEDDPELGDDLDEDDPDDKPPRQDLELPPLYAHGDADPRPLKSWAVKHFIPRCGHGLLSGQWGTGKTFIVFDLAAALGTGQPFLGHAVKHQCGVLLIAAEGADEVRLRLDAVVRAKCGGMSRAPFRWYETAPMLLHKGSVETLIAMARQADDSLQQEFGLPLGLIVIDTIAACAGYAKTGDENDNAVGQAIMNVLKTVAQTLGCFVLAVDHFGKNLEAGTRGAYSKESAGDLVLACLGEKELSGGAVVSALIKLPSRPLGRPSAAADAVYKRDRATFAEDIQEFRSRLEFAVSARGWGYVLEGEGAVNKDDIDLVEKLINECRKDGVLPLNICALDAKREFSNVERIDDTTPEEEAEAAYDFCKSTAERYLPFSFWDFQDCYLQMTVEKIDIKSLFDPVCAEFSVPLANRGGWSDLNTLGEMMERFAFWERKGKRCNLLDFADHDPAGQLISDTLRSNMRDLSRAVGWSPDNLHIDRFGLSDDTVNKLGLVWINNLITNKGLRLDDRKHPDHFKPYVQEYIARFGVRKVEANALLKRPQAGRNLCRKAILKYVKPRGIQAFEAALEPRRQAVNIAIQRLLRRRRS